MYQIEIRDVGTTAVYHLDGGRLEMVRSGGCRDVLGTDGAWLDGLDLDEIADAVEAAWIDGYEGDPTENGLAVSVSEIE